MTDRPRLLFVCIENSNRSQMAEAFARMHAGDRVEAISAGSRPSGRINPRAIEAMRERGYDLTTHRSTGLDAVPPGRFDVVVTMGCGDECPFIPADRRVDWSLPDPRDMPPAEFNGVRDEIERRVVQLLGELAVPGRAP
jgi:arsenate reductase